MELDIGEVAYPYILMSRKLGKESTFFVDAARFLISRDDTFQKKMRNRILSFSVSHVEEN